MDNNKIEEKIAILKEKIESWESTDPAYLDDELKQLRNYVMYVHLRLEASLELLLVSYFFRSLSYAPTTTEISQLLIKIEPLLNQVSFYKKMEIAKNDLLIPGKLIEKLKPVNKLRNYFSHPKSYQREIEGYNDRRKYHRVLKTLTDALEEMDKIFEGWRPVGQPQRVKQSSKRTLEELVSNL